jgi:hypothetical protein
MVLVHRSKWLSEELLQPLNETAKCLIVVKRWLEAAFSF